VINIWEWAQLLLNYERSLIIVNYYFSPTKCDQSGYKNAVIINVFFNVLLVFSFYYISCCDTSLLPATSELSKRPKRQRASPCFLTSVLDKAARASLTLKSAAVCTVTPIWERLLLKNVNILSIIACFECVMLLVCLYLNSGYFGSKAFI